MAKKKTPTNDEYFDKLAAATDENRERGWTDDYEGQLAVDVYQTKTSIVIRAAIAGVQAEDIDVSVNNDMVTIKGTRHIDDAVDPGAFLYQECYWGGFSRTIILPVEVKADKVSASLKNGILRVTLPKMNGRRPNPFPLSTKTKSNFMTISIVAVHPTITIVRAADRQVELPTDWFPTTPKVGQNWSLEFGHQSSDAEQLEQLNAYLARD